MRESRCCSTQAFVEMCCPNKAIVCERLPIHTVDEVLEELNGSMVFSKLDLCWGFHQRVTCRFKGKYYFYYP